MSERKAPARLKKELDRCVKCGMCLAECPTYRLDSNENESPRGRISLIEGLLSGRLQADETLSGHLENCLGCRRCERVCPSQVRYGYLIDTGRTLTAAGRRPGWSRLVQSPAVQRWGSRLSHAFPLALSRPLGALHRMHAVARALPAGARAPGPGEYPPPGRRARGRVGLFTGCATAAQQGGALHAALRLLNHAGFAVSVPRDAGCCGALSQHAGEPERAEAMAAANRRVFAAQLDAVISVASGCGIQLDEYAPPLPAPHRDVCRFLLEQGELDPADFAEYSGAVMLHVPCSVENVYRGSGWARAVLELVPGLEVLPVGRPGECCGAAGDHMLRRPDRAARLRAPLLEQVAATDSTLLVTSNVGCAMHVADGLRERGLNVEVLHPVEVLARQLRS